MAGAAEPPADPPASEAASGPARLAAIALAVLAIASPWPFGSVAPWAVYAVSAAALTAATAALVWAGRGSGLLVPAVSLRALLGLLALGAVQCVPLPETLHALIAPGSHQVWHPTEPAAADVLGAIPRPVSVDPDGTLRWLGLTWGLTGLALLAAPAFRASQTARRTALLVVTGGLALATFGIVARARFGALLYGYIPVASGSPFGPFVNKNHFAGYLAMATPLALGLMTSFTERARARGRSRDWAARPEATRVVLAVAAALAMAFAALVALSRGGAISLAAGVVAFFAARHYLARPPDARASLLRWRGPGAVLLVAALLVIALPEDTHQRLRGYADKPLDSSGSFRLDTWRSTLGMVGASPWLGHGMGSFHAAYPRFKRGYGHERVEHAENDYLELLAEGGLVGFGLALAVVAGAGRRSWLALRDGQRTTQRGVALGALAGLLALAVHSLVDFNLRIPSNAALAAFLAAAALGSAGVRLVPLSPLRCRILAALVGSCLLATSSIWLARDEDPAEILQRAASAPSAVARSLRVRQADAVLRSAVNRRPADAPSWLLLAWIYAERGDATAATALATHAVSLDPQHAALRAAAEPFIRSAQ